MGRESRCAVHRGPDRILDPLTALRRQDPGFNQLVQGGAQEAQRGAARLVRGAVRMLLRKGIRRREETRLLVRKTHVGGPDRAQATLSGRRVAALSPNAGDLSSHPVSELKHGSGTHFGEQFVAVGEMPVGSVRYDADRARRLSQYDGVGTAGASQLDPGRDQAGAHVAARAPSSGRSLRCWVGRRHALSITMWTLSTKAANVDSVH